MWNQELYLVTDLSLSSYPSRVHITEATLYKLNNEYQVEPYLSHPVQTYLILSNQVTVTTPARIELIDWSGSQQ